MKNGFTIHQISHFLYLPYRSKSFLMFQIKNKFPFNERKFKQSQTIDRVSLATAGALTIQYSNG